MKLRRRGRVMIGGRRVQRVDLRVVRGYRFRGCPIRCVLIFAFGPEEYGCVAERSVLRVYVIGGPASSVSLGVLSRTDAGLKTAERVLRTATFVDGV